MTEKKIGLLKFFRGQREITVPIDKPVFTIGRSLHADIRLIKDPKVSREHCRISQNEHGFLIEDLESRNGTFVNDHQITVYSLELGDKIRVGEREFLFIEDRRRGEGLNSGKADLLFCSKCQGSILHSEIVKGLVEKRDGEFICAECSDTVSLSRKLFQNYEILGKIAQGGFGVVYKVKHKIHNTVAALKLIREGKDADEEVLKRFMREIKLGARLDHPNIVKFIDAGEEEGVKYLIMEFVQGKSIAELIKAKGNLLEDLHDIVLQLFDAVEALHTCDIVHRDIKPENILVTRKREVKLIDFGLVKNLSSTSVSAITTIGEGIGTLYYIPVEQLENASKIDHRADIYGLGATIYEMMCGCPPVKGRNFAELIEAIRSEYREHPSEINPDVPARLGDWILKALALRPEKRYKNISQFRKSYLKAIS